MLTIFGCVSVVSLSAVWCYGLWIDHRETMARLEHHHKESMARLGKGA